MASNPEERTMDTTTMTPAEIDTELARIYAEQTKVAGWIAADLRTLANPKLTERARMTVKGHLARLRQIDEANLRAEAAPYEAEYRSRGGWRRYFLVTNGNGHVHRGMDCSTCYPTTEFGWLIDLADCDEDAMIVEYGEKACTVCFPTAPANPAFHAPGRRDAAARAERDAEKAAKAAAKAEKAITAPDGSPLRVGYNRIATKVAAQRALSSAVQSYGWYGPTHPDGFAEQVRVLAEALTAAGIDPQPIIARAAKKVAAEGGTHRLPTLVTA